MVSEAELSGAGWGGGGAWKGQNGVMAAGVGGGVGDCPEMSVH